MNSSSPLERFGLSLRRHDRGVGYVVSEVGSDFGDEMAWDGGGVHDVGDERRRAEGFGYDGSVLDQGVVAVVSEDEYSAVGNWMRRWSRGSRRWWAKEGSESEKQSHGGRRRDKSLYVTTSDSFVLSVFMICVARKMTRNHHQKPVLKKKDFPSLHIKKTSTSFLMAYQSLKVLVGFHSDQVHEKQIGDAKQAQSYLFPQEQSRLWLK